MTLQLGFDGVRLVEGPDGVDRNTLLDEDRMKEDV